MVANILVKFAAIAIGLNFHAVNIQVLQTSYKQQIFNQTSINFYYEIYV